MKSALRVLLQPAYLLHHRDYRDSSRILDLLTRDHGRIGAVARGVRRPKSRLRSVLQPFLPLLVSWSGAGELVTLTGAEPERTLPGLQGERLLSAFYMNELLLRLLERHDPHGTLFDDYGAALQALRGDGHAGRALRIFEKRLLDSLGYGLELAHEAETGRPVDGGALYQYRLETGAVRAGVGERGRLVYAGESLLSLHREELADARSRRDAQELLSAALRLYLGERPLRTREVLRSMRHGVSRRG